MTMIDFTERVAALAAENAKLTQERDEAREWVRKLTAEQRVLTCVYCGHAYPPGTPASNHEALTTHIMGCEKHPASALWKERDEARMECSRLHQEIYRLNSLLVEHAGEDAATRLKLADAWRTIDYLTAEKE